MKSSDNTTWLDWVGISLIFLVVLAIGYGICSFLNSDKIYTQVDMDEVNLLKTIPKISTATTTCHFNLPETKGKIGYCESNSDTVFIKLKECQSKGGKLDYSTKLETLQCFKPSETLFELKIK